MKTRPPDQVRHLPSALVWLMALAALPSCVEATVNAAGATINADISAGSDATPEDTVDALPIDDTTADSTAAAHDAGVNDAGAKDAGAKDAGAKDAGAKDAGAKDAGAKDAGAKDAGAKDAGAKDAGANDAGQEDSTQPADTQTSIDAGAPGDSGSGGDAPSSQDISPACVPTQPPADICDGVDNDCTGGVDTLPCASKACFTVSCEGVKGCVYKSVSGGSCQDGNPCTTADTCTKGICSGKLKSCDDGNGCTTDSCAKGTGVCTHVANTAACSDGNPCTIGDACKKTTCQAGAAKKCSDGNACDGIETCNPSTGKCSQPTAPKCPWAPGECNQSGGSVNATMHKLTVAPATGFRMTDQGTWSKNAALIAKIGAHSSASVVSLSTVLSALNRQGVKLNSVPQVKCLHRGFSWNSGDSAVDYWYPQGITGSWDAYGGGTYSGKKVLMASWYHKPDKDSSTSTNKGGRLSIADVTKTGGPKYRNVLLVEPYTDSSGKPNFKPIVFHAGGAVWFGNYLYLPHTTKGLRVFDISKFIKVKTGDKNAVGWSSKSNAYMGYNYGFVLPQVGYYSLCKTCCVRLSFVGLDRTTKPPRLVTGEYAKSDYRGRLHGWALDAKTFRLKTVENLVQGQFAFFPGVRRMQGALTIGGEVWISSSDKYPGTLTVASLYRYAGVGAPLLIRRLPRVPEDVSYHKQEAALWTLTEDPKKRWVWSMPETKLTSSVCK